MRKFDLIRRFPTRMTVEVKADLRCRDRVCFEEAAVDHTEADKWAQWIPGANQFWQFDTLAPKQLIADNRKSGYKLYYTHNDGEHGETCVYVPLVKLLTFKPQPR